MINASFSCNKSAVDKILNDVSSRTCSKLKQLIQSKTKQNEKKKINNT